MKHPDKIEKESLDIIKVLILLSLFVFLQDEFQAVLLF